MRRRWVRRLWALVTPWHPGASESVALRLYTSREDAAADPQASKPGVWVGEYHLLEPIIDRAGLPVATSSQYDTIVLNLRRILLKRAEQVTLPEERRAYLDAIALIGRLSPFEFDVRPGKQPQGDAGHHDIEVYLNNTYIRHAVAADPERGELLTIRVDAEGFPVLDGDGDAILDLLQGRVIVRKRDGVRTPLNGIGTPPLKPLR